jgi:LPS O-antigen subunit length determinant protein (WzzB/FepE family)
MMHGNEQGARDDSISLIEFGSVVWQGKWVLIGTILLTVGLAWCYILTAASWYRVEVLLKPTDTRSNQGLSGQVGGALASLAGIDVNSSISAEPVAVLKSNEFTANFINEQHLLPILFRRPTGHPRRREVLLEENTECPGG